MPNYRYNSPNCMRQNMPGRNMAELIGMPVAMAYVPWTQWHDIYDADKGFSRGTIFKELDKPFHGIGGCQNVR